LKDLSVHIVSSEFRVLKLHQNLRNKNADVLWTQCIWRRANRKNAYLLYQQWNPKTEQPNRRSDILAVVVSISIYCWRLFQLRKSSYRWLRTAE